MHVFTFEVWTHDQLTSTRSYPLPVPARTGIITAETPQRAREIAQSRICPSSRIGAGQHLRSACVPPHPGRD